MGTPRGQGRDSSAVAVLLIARPRPHPITMQPLLSPPAWPACASLGPPGTRHQIGVKIPRVSFAAVDGADNRDRLAGGEQRRRGRFSIKASPLSAAASGRKARASTRQARPGEFHDGQLASAAVCCISAGQALAESSRTL